MRLPELTDGVWISGSENIDSLNTPPYLLKKSFFISKEVKCAWVCVSALGCFSLSFNQRFVTEELLAPGYSQYNKRVLYKRYEVTEFLKQGENEIFAELANGWYTGRLGLVLKNNCFGNKRAFRMMLNIIYADESREIIETDKTWLVSQEGPRRMAEFFDGEVFDARIDLDKISYRPVMCFNILADAMGAGKKKFNSSPEVELFDGASVLLQEKAEPKEISIVGEDTVLLDFGTNSSKIIALENIEFKESVELIGKLSKYNKEKTAIVLIGGNMLMLDPWYDSVKGILMAYYPGMRGGEAIIETLFGDNNPSGKLPFVVVKKETDLPQVDWSAEEVHYEYYHGYKKVDKEKIQPRLPYGYGLSYTSFRLDDIRIAKADEEKVSFALNVTNTGSRKGGEVVQLYIGFPESKVDRPVRSFIDFGKVYLEAGESQEVLLEVNKSDLAYYDEKQGSFVEENVPYKAYIGTCNAPAYLTEIPFSFS